VRRARPLSAQPEIRPTPLAALGALELPTSLHFVRSHFGVPPLERGAWTLELAGAVERPLTFSLADLKERQSVTKAVVLECAGHRRNEFRPGAAGLQWGLGAVSEARWTGVRLADLLAEALPADGACEVLMQGVDRGPHKASPVDVRFARSISFGRAAGGDVLLAWEMNGRPIPPKHGAPLRAIVPGCYAVDSVKWLGRIEVLTRPFSGPFQRVDYRLRESANDGDGAVLHELRVNALIVTPSAGARLGSGVVELSGVAWGGRGGVESVELRAGGGAWKAAELAAPGDETGLSHWAGTLELPPGEHTIEVRAHDGDGNVQPAVPEWNVLGYANNSIHRVPITVWSAAA